MPELIEHAPSATPLRNPARRDQILSAAMKCFRENGFHASSMAELAKQAGMSVGHIYHYFENKDAIIEAIVDRDMEEVRGVLDEFSRADDVVVAIMDRLEEAVERHVDRDWAALRLEVLAEAARNPRIAAKLHAADAAARNRLTQVLSGQLASLGAREVADRVEAICATFEGLTVRAVHNPDLDRKAVVRTTGLVLRELLTNGTTASSPR
jgi:TetR/AcrR family transcriptional repressor of uid operon